MSGDTVRPLHIANNFFYMVTSEISHHVESCQYQYYISTGHRLCPIIIKLALYDLQNKPNKCAKQLFLVQNRLAVTANQTWRQSLAATLKVVNNNITYPQPTNNLQSSWNLPEMLFRPSRTNLQNNLSNSKPFGRDSQSNLTAKTPCPGLSCFGVSCFTLVSLSCFSPCLVKFPSCVITAPSPNVFQLLLVACPVCVWYLSPCLSFVPCRIILVRGELCPVCYLCSLCSPHHPCSLPFELIN